MEEELASCIIDCDHDDMTCLGDCVREYDQNIENCPCKSGNLRDKSRKLPIRGLRDAQYDSRLSAWVPVRAVYVS